MFVRIKIEGFPHNKCKLSITNSSIHDESLIQLCVEVDILNEKGFNVYLFIIDLSRL
jgi:hypothetical protein